MWLIQLVAVVFVISSAFSAFVTPFKIVRFLLNPLRNSYIVIHEYSRRLLTFAATIRFTVWEPDLRLFSFFCTLHSHKSLRARSESCGDFHWCMVWMGLELPS